MGWLLPALPPKFEAALRDVQARTVEARLAAAERLGRAEGDELEPAIDGLLELLSDVHPGVRATALAALGAVGRESELPSVAALLTDAAPEVRELAAVALAQIGGEDAAQCLLEALTSPEPEVRFQAVAGLAELAPEHACDHLLPLLGDLDPEVRAQVASVLGQLDAPHLVGQLAHALEDDIWGVRFDAALALAEYRDARGVQTLREALTLKLRVGEAARALASLKVTESADALAELAGSWRCPPELRAALGAALVELGDARGEQALRKVLKGLRGDARSYAVELTGQVDAVGLAPELARLAQRPRGTDLLTLVEALSRYADRAPAAASALSQLAKRSDAVGDAARRALSASDPSPIAALGP
jgi:HEAT repeat protein